MFRLAMVALVAAVAAIGSTDAVVRLAQGHPGELRALKAEAALTGRDADVLPRAAVVMKAGDGHYWADGDVNGHGVRFLVDTGATAVALTPADARRLGFRLDHLQFGYDVVTAGGRARAASVKLASVTVAGARMENVDALVIEKGLDASLLGMSYLGRLSSFQATRQALFLRP